MIEMRMDERRHYDEGINVRIDICEKDENTIPYQQSKYKNEQEQVNDKR